MFLQRKKGHWEEEGTGRAIGCISVMRVELTFFGRRFCVHSDEEWDKGNDHGSYTQVPGNTRWIVTGQHWVVDEPAQEEQGHWEYK
ncbi:MAG: hypothetical protein ACLUFM_03720 [Lachnospiraceae bacterium]